MTIKELSQRNYLEKEIQQLQDRIDVLENLVTGTTAVITGMPRGSGTSDKVGNLVVEIETLKDKLQLRKEQLIQELARLEDYIACVEDSYIRQILSLRYIKGLSWQQVANEIGNNTADSVRKACYRYVLNI